MTNFLEKLKLLDYLVLYKNNDRHTAAQIEAKIDEMHLVLPEDYLAFLKECPDTGYFRSSIAFVGGPASPWAPDGKYPIATLFAYGDHDGPNDLFVIHARNWGLPKDYLAIGDDDGDNTFCLDLRAETFGQVSFYLQDVADNEERFYLLASSFTEFIYGLEEQDY